MNNALLAADISNRIPELALENQNNRFELVQNLIKQEQQRRPVTVKETLTPDQRFELGCLRDYLQREFNREHRLALGRVTKAGGGATSDHERNCEHWLKVLNEIL